MQVETAALVRSRLISKTHEQMLTKSVKIRAAEEFQTLIRNLQELWLFGQLKTVGNDEAQQKTDEDARMIAELLGQLLNSKSSQAVSSQDAEVTIKSG